jgi:hypothetical protein
MIGRAAKKFSEVDLSSREKLTRMISGVARSRFAAAKRIECAR